MFDPSKLSPQTISEITDLMRLLTPEQMMKMQSLMHNQMAGFNVTNEMMEFEKGLPPSFREKMARIMYMANGIQVPPQAASTSSEAIPAQASSVALDSVEDPKDENEARLIILKSVQNGMMTAEAALKVLFP